MSREREAELRNLLITPDGKGCDVKREALKELLLLKCPCKQRQLKKKKKDLLNTTCQSCRKGMLVENCFFDDIDEMLKCRQCGVEVKRFPRG